MKLKLFHAHTLWRTTGLVVLTVAFCVCSSASYQAFADSSSFRFVSWGDTKTGLSALASLSNQANSLNPTFTIYSGDLCDSGFTVSCMDAWKNAKNGSSDNGMFDKTCPVRGNHDSSDTAGWQAYFDLRATALRIGATNYTELNEDLTYSFDYGNSHFIGVDVLGDATVLSPTQISWIDNDLAAAEQRGLTHAFIYFHGPIYSVANHCSCPIRTCDTPLIIASLIDVLNRHPIVSATFHGHDHTYAFVHIDSSRISEVLHPFEQFVTGDAGAGPAGCSKTYRFDYCMDSHGLVTVDVFGNTFTINFYAQDNMIPAKTLTFGVEVVSTPNIVSGTTNGLDNVSYSYSTGGSSSNLDHPVQYLFDWGDGTDSGWLPVGTTSASKSWTSGGTYPVKVLARCANDTTVVSPWSTPLSVTINAFSIVSPNGGETLTAGSTQTIRWSYGGNPGSFVRIDLLKGGVVTKTISYFTSIGSAGSGSYNWSIPSTQTSGSDYQIKVTSTSNSSYTDTSYNNFTIVGPPPPTISVTSPNGGDSLTAGSTQTIRWSYGGKPGSFVKIELLKGGVVTKTISYFTSIGSAGSGSYNWAIPSNQTSGSDYSVRIASATNSSYTDMSDSNFTIVGPPPPTISVAFPNGEDTLTAGSTQTIRWTYDGNPGSFVRIELLKGGVVTNTISYFTSIGSAGSGSYNWSIPSTQTAGSDYQIKVTSATNAAYTDTSDSSFRISN